MRSADSVSLSVSFESQAEQIEWSHGAPAERSGWIMGARLKNEPMALALVGSPLLSLSSLHFLQFNKLPLWKSNKPLNAAINKRLAFVRSFAVVSLQKGRKEGRNERVQLRTSLPPAIASLSFSLTPPSVFSPPLSAKIPMDFPLTLHGKASPRTAASGRAGGEEGRREPPRRGASQ